MSEDPGKAPFSDAGQSSDSSGTEPVWTYRGYKLRSSEFTTAMVHFFRAEVSRANVWRQRLDATTNWAVLTTGAAISFSFGQPTGNHALIILNILLVTLFLFIEARRYRYYELWSTRVRLMETDFFAAMLVPPFRPDPDWAESLAESLLQPHFPISLWEALGRRLRRNYLAIYLILGMSWLAKLWLHPQGTANLAEIVRRAEIWLIPGWIVFLFWLILTLTLILLAVITATLHEASGEVLPRFTVPGISFIGEQGETGDLSRFRAWFRHGAQRRQLLALIITDQPGAVSKKVLDEMQRGVTELSGKGAYTGKTHGVLLCALTVTEVAHLKELVSKADPTAFVIVSPVQEILGKGFMPLKVEKKK
jgi:uncharacterized membrane protein